MDRSKLKAPDKTNSFENQGLKKNRWSKHWLARLSMFVMLIAAFAALYLIQSSQIVTSAHHVQQLRDELTRLQQDNALLSVQISTANHIDRMTERAKQLGFVPAEEIIYLAVKSQPVDDVPSIQSAYRR